MTDIREKVERKEPYSDDEKRVCDYIRKLTNDQVGCGDDPIGFLIAQHAELYEEYRKPTHQHLGRGFKYTKLGEAEVQISKPSPALMELQFNYTGDSKPCRPLVEGNKLTVYRAIKSGLLWVRFPDEFDDGRFKKLED